MLKNLFIATALISLISCKNQTEEMSLSDVDYCPLKVGDVKLYSIDSILFNPFTQKADSFHLDIQEQVAEKYLDAENDSAYRLTWSVYDSGRNEWKVFKSFSRKTVNNMTYETFDNQTLAILRHPIANATTGIKYQWNLHLKNSSDPMYIYYSAVAKPYLNHSNTVMSKLSSPVQGIVTKSYQAVYAENIGLVYKYIEMTDQLTGNNIKNGWIVKQSIQ